LVEQALFFGIGFLAASLAAILVIPAFLRRAARLSEARLRLDAPLTEKQAAAERDAIRARHAVEQVRLEQRLSLLNDDHTRLKVELGRQSVKIIEMEATAAERESHNFDLSDRMAKAEAERRNLEVALAASQIALNDIFTQRDRANLASAAAIARRDQLEAEANVDRARIAILIARGENAAARFDDLSRSAKAAAEQAEKAHTELTDALARQTAESSRLEARLREATVENEQLRRSLSRREAHLAELESRLALSDRAREETLLENGRQLARIADSETALRTARDAVVEREARLAAISADAHAQESGAALHAHQLSSALAAAEGSLRAARADREALQQEVETLSARVAVALSASSRNGEDDAALRESIERLGREVGRLYAEQESVDRRDDRAPKRRSSVGRKPPVALIDPPNNDRHDFDDGRASRVARSRAPDH
jgi:chromosome segregation ATPase